MSTQQLPVTASDMVAYIESQIDLPSLSSALAASQTAYDIAGAELVEIRLQLAEHEARASTAPDQWATLQKQLVNVVEVLESVVKLRTTQLAQAESAIPAAIELIIGQLQAEVDQLSEAAQVQAHIRIEQIRNELAAIERGDFPDIQTAKAQATALQIAFGELMTKYPPGASAPN